MEDLKKMTEQIVQIFNAYEKQGTTKWTYNIAAHDLQYQIGNLTKAILQLRGFRYTEGLTNEQIKANASDELADIMAEVLFIAHELDIDLGKAWDNMIESDKKKISKRSDN